MMLIIHFTIRQEDSPVYFLLFISRSFPAHCSAGRRIVSPHKKNEKAVTALLDYRFLLGRNLNYSIYGFRQPMGMTYTPSSL